MTDETIIQERTDFKRGSFDYEFLLMRAADKCRIAGSVEFRGGYWMERPTLVNNNVVQERVYVPDTRKVFIESVTTMSLLLEPKKDEEFIKAMNELDKEVVSAKKAREKNSNKEEATAEFYTEMVRIKREEFRQIMLLIARMGLTGLRTVQEIVDPEADYE